MKAILTIIFLFVLNLGSYAQFKPSSNQKDGVLISGMIVENQSFVIKKIFPNPVKDLVTIDIKIVSSGNIQINLYNILGSEVKKFEPIFLSEGDQQFQLDLSMLKQGIYILKVNMSGQVLSQIVKKS
jgi:hypothetical protein